MHGITRPPPCRRPSSAWCALPPFVALCVLLVCRVVSFTFRRVRPCYVVVLRFPPTSYRVLPASALFFL